jgi:hypothetical protein
MVCASFTGTNENILFRSQSSPMPETLLTRQKWSSQKGKMQSVYRASVLFILIFFPSGNTAFQARGPCILRTRLLLAGCFSAADSRKTATKQQANKKLERTWYRFNRSFYGQKDH